MSTFEPSQQVAAFAAAAYTAGHAISLITDQTSVDMACDAVKEAIQRSLPLASVELTLANLLRDEEGFPPPSLQGLFFQLNNQISILRASGRFLSA
ncbi:MAG: hypothetical protein P4L11_13530 [Geothrix sp.]|nr:hypothetical protein [Geothrix sp.]